MHDTEAPRLVAPIPAYAHVLAVIAHPDDVEALCGGTVALLRDAGARVSYVLLTSGDKGSPDPLADRVALGARREAEQLAAAALLDVAEVIFLRRFDGEVSDDAPTRAALAAQIRRLRPDLLLTFDPWYDYSFHNDHRQCGFVALAAARTLARRPGPVCGPAGEVVAPLAPPHAIPEVWFFHTERPTIVFDIAPTIARKAAARVAHASQAADPVATARGIYTRAAAVGERYGLALAESFRAVPFPADESFAARLAAAEW